ncbi:MAG: NfeD family protein [Anaerolineales bacterium]|nr:NfeD family protein [Anaerolineales bacterium]
MFGLPILEAVYWFFAITGGTLFILRILMMFIGGGLSDDALDVALESNDNVAESHNADGDASFKLLSLQGLTAFFMMFGLVGLALLNTNLPSFLSVIGGTVAGLLTFGALSFIFSKMKLLQSEGTIQLKNSIGAEGNVYLKIPKNGTGQVQIVTQGALKIFDATSNNKQDLITGDKIRVVGVDGNTLVVEKVK